MKSRNEIAVFFSALILSALACNVGVQAPTSNNPNLAAATIVAQTLQAQGLPTSEQPQVLNSPAPFASPVAAATATISTPILTINQAVNCRKGPGDNFDTVTSFDTGIKVEIAGKDNADSYWVVKIPNSTDICWVAAQYGTASGDYSSLPEMTPSASTAGVPPRPGALYFNFTCTNSATSVTTDLKWVDNADNEKGYRVYRGETMIADLPANSTTYTDNTTITYGSVLTYYVEAYNDAGASPRRTASFSCQ